MKFQELVEIVGSLPVFETGLLVTGTDDPASIRRQLSRWVRGGRIVQLRRGLYALAPPCRATPKTLTLRWSRTAPTWLLPPNEGWAISYSGNGRSSVRVWPGKE